MPPSIARSIILEGSNEGKSHSSASSGGSTTCGGTTTVEWSRHTNNATADQSKKELAATTAEWSHHGNNATADQSKKGFAATTAEWSHHGNNATADQSKKELAATTAEWSHHGNNATADQSKKESAAPKFDSDEFAPKFDPMLDCTQHNIDTTNYVPGDVTMAGDPFEISIGLCVTRTVLERTRKHIFLMLLFQSDSYNIYMNP